MLVLRLGWKAIDSNLKLLILDYNSGVRFSDLSAGLMWNKAEQLLKVVVNAGIY